MKLKQSIYDQVLRLDKLKIPRIENPYLYHASESGECKRSLVLNRLGKPSERKENTKIKQAELQMLFKDGHLHQAAITDYMKQMPGYHVTNIEEDRYKRVELPNGGYIWIFGHPDAIIYEVKTKKRAVFEAKGLNTFYCTKLIDYEIGTLRDIYGKAIPQARMYSNMWDTDDGANVTVKDKNNSSLREWEIPRDEEIENKIIQKFVNVAMAVLDTQPEEKIPPCDWMKGDKRCNFCKYPNDCGVGRI